MKRKIPISITYNFYKYPIPTIKIFSKNNTKITHKNQSISINITTLSKNNFNIFNYTTKNTKKTTNYIIKLKQTNIQKKIT